MLLFATNGLPLCQVIHSADEHSHEVNVQPPVQLRLVDVKGGACALLKKLVAVVA